MLVEQHIVSIRRQFTGESLAGARRRLQELPNWSALLPAARDHGQGRLESHLLEAIGTASGRHPLGISEVIPYSDRLFLRLESAEHLRAVLALLPYRDGRRSRHGIVDLRATAKRATIELILGRSGSGRVILAGPRGTCDMVAALAEHHKAVEARRHVPLWTEDTPHDPPRRPVRNSRPMPRRHGFVPVADPKVGSAVLRRIHLWKRVAGGGTVTVTRHSPSETTPLWTVVRSVPMGSDLHDDDIARVLADPVAGTGLVPDENSHHCDAERCSQTFASGRLIVRSIRCADAPSSRPRAGGRLTLAVLDERERAGLATNRSPRGHVLHLIDPMGDTRGPAQAADQLAAAWALQGLRTLVLPSNARNVASETPWRRARITGGTGIMCRGAVDEDGDDLRGVVDKARTMFDHIVMVSSHSSLSLIMPLYPLADDHLIVADGHFPRATTTTVIRAGRLERQDTALAPAESAMAWLQRELARVPFADVPMTGLLLRDDPQEAMADSFVGRVDSELVRYGLPVLGRLPRAASLAPERTVLDHMPADQRDFIMGQSTRVRDGLGSARADEAMLLTAVRRWLNC